MKEQERTSRWVDRVYTMQEFCEVLNLPKWEQLIQINVSAFEVKVITSKGTENGT